MPVSINGQIVGYFMVGGIAHGFLYSGSSFTTIDAPGATTHTEAFEINDSGQIGGYVLTALHGCRAFLDTDGNFTTLDFPGADSTAAARS